MADFPCDLAVHPVTRSDSLKTTPRTVRIDMPPSQHLPTRQILCRFRTMLVLMAVLLAALAVVPAALGQAGQSRTVLSVVTIRNQAKEAIAYHVQWPGGSWQ